MYHRNLGWYNYNDIHIYITVYTNVDCCIKITCAWFLAILGFPLCVWVIISTFDVVNGESLVMMFLTLLVIQISSGLIMIVGRTVLTVNNLYSGVSRFMCEKNSRVYYQWIIGYRPSNLFVVVLTLVHYI